MANLFDFEDVQAPNFADYMPQGQPVAAPNGPPQPTGRGNLVSAGLMSGLHQGIGLGGSAVQGISTLAGADSIANAARAFAAREQATAATYERPDLEANPWSFKGILYKAMQAVPTIVGGVGAGLAATAGAPEEAAGAAVGGLARWGLTRAAVGGGGFAGLLGLGGNVQEGEQATSAPLTREQAAKATALAVPEGILGGIVPGGLERVLSRGATGILKGAAVTGAEQAGVGAAQSFLTQQMGDPNRSFADRAQEAVESALSGGIVGALTGAGIHAIAKRPIPNIKNADLRTATDEPLGLPPEPPPPTNTLWEPKTPSLVENTPWGLPQEGEFDRGQVEHPPLGVGVRTPSAADFVTGERTPPETPPQAPFEPNLLKPGEFDRGQAEHPPLGEITPVPKEEDFVSDHDQAEQKQLQDAVAIKSPLQAALKKAPDLATAQDIARAKLGDRTDDSPPIKGSLLPVYQTLGVVDDRGNVIPKSAEAAPVGVQRDAILDKAHQARWDQLNQLQQTIAGDPKSDLQHLLPQLENAKAVLQKPTGPDVSRTDALIRSAKTAVEGDKAQQDIAATTGVEAPPRQPIEPEPKPTDVAPVGAAPPKSAQDFVVRMLAERQTSQVAKTQAKAPKTQVEAKTASAEKVPDVLAPVAAQIEKTKESLAQLTVDTRVVPRPNASPTMFAKSALSPGGVAGFSTRNASEAFKSALAVQAKRLDQIDQAVKSGDLTKIQAIENNHFGTELWDDPKDEYFDQLNSKTQQVLGEHVENEQRVIDALRNIFPKETPRVAPGTPTTYGVLALSHILANGGTSGDFYRYIQEHGSSPDAQLLAASLLRTHPDIPVRFTSPNGIKFDNDRVGNNPAGSYNAGLNRVNIYNTTDLESTILHEGIHAATMRALAGNGQAAAELKRLYGVVKVRSPENDAYGLTNAKEFIAEAFTNSRFQDFLRTQAVSTGSVVGDVWQSLKNTVFRVLGMPERARTMFDQVMDTGSHVMKENPTQPHIGASTEAPRLFGSPKDQDEKLRIASAGLEVPKQQGLSMLRDEAAGKALNLGVGARKTIYSWADTGFIGELNEKNAPSIKVHADLIRTRENREGLNNKMLKVGLDQAEALPEEGKKLINQLAAGLNEGLDGRQGWEAQMEAHAAKNSGDLAKDHAVLKRAYEHLKGIPGGAEAYDTLIKGNQAALVGLHALKLDDMVRGDKIFSAAKIAGFENDLGNDYQFEGAKLAMHDSPALSRTYFMAELQKRLDGAKTYANIVNGEIAKFDPGKAPDKGALTDKLYEEALAKHAAAVSDFVAKKQDLLGQIAPLVSLAKASQDALDNVKKDVANFHQGREDGSYFVAARLATDEDGTTKADVAQKLYQRLADDGFKNVTLQQHAENKNIYVRVNTPANLQRMTEVFNKAHVEGLLDKDTGVKSGDATNPNVLGHIAPLWMEKVLSILRDNAPELSADATDKDKVAYKFAQDKSIADASRQMLSMLPDSSIKKVLARRQGVQGFDADMLNNYRQRAIATSRLMANISTARNISDSITGMRNDVLAANENMKLTTNQKLSVSAAVNEVLLREAQRSVSVPSSFVSGLRLWTHNLEVGSSPGYVATLFLQNFTTSLPRLGSVVGYGNALGAMSRALPITTKITRAAMLSKDAATYGLRNADLEAAGLSKTDIDFWMHHAAMGDTTYGSYTHGIRGDEGDSKFGKIGMMAGAMGLHAEMMPRNLMMFAARDAWRGVEKDGDLHDFVSRMIRKSQMDWTTSLNSRQQGQMGTFGSASPLIFQFMSWQIKFTQTLYKEAADAFGKGSTPEEARLARRFLAGHLAAVTALSGTMGLPMVGVMATVYDRLKDAFMGEDNNDLQAAYRNFLSDTFGHDAGELIARGLPRALGVDLTHEVGEEKLVPGSSALELLAEKRKAADAEKDYLKLMGGSALGVGANWIMGLRDITNQDYLQGMQKILPDLPRNFVEAGQLALRGYVNKSGTPLPNLTPSAHDVLLEAIGLEPSQLAEYNETKKVAMGEKNMASLRSQNISEHLALAEQRHDPANFQYWMGQSQEYQQEHRGQTSPALDFQRYIMEQVQQAGYGRTLKMPLGTSLQDLIARGMVRFGNLPSQ